MAGLDEGGIIRATQQEERRESPADDRAGEAVQEGGCGTILSYIRVMGMVLL